VTGESDSTSARRVEVGSVRGATSRSVRTARVVSRTSARHEASRSHWRVVPGESHQLARSRRRRAVRDRSGPVAGPADAHGETRLAGVTRPRRRQPRVS
jgi:hypothetical protein